MIVLLASLVMQPPPPPAEAEWHLVGEPRFGPYVYADIASRERVGGATAIQVMTIRSANAGEPHATQYRIEYNCAARLQRRVNSGEFYRQPDRSVSFRATLSAPEGWGPIDQNTLFAVACENRTGRRVTNPFADGEWLLALDRDQARSHDASSR